MNDLQWIAAAGAYVAVVLAGARWTSNRLRGQSRPATIADLQRHRAVHEKERKWKVNL